MGSQSQTGLKRLAHEGGVKGLSALYPTVGGTTAALGPLPPGLLSPRALESCGERGHRNDILAFVG